MLLINLAIADDHAIFRNGLVASLEPFRHICIKYVAASGEELIEHIKTLPVQVVLMDMKMSGMDGIETTRMLKKMNPEIKVLGLSVFENHNYITNMFKAGANGYLLKDATPEQIVEAVECVSKNEYYFNELVSYKLLKSLMEMEHPSTQISNEFVPLTNLEIEIIKLIGLELTNAEIAAKLNLGTKTIENYRNKLLTKTGAKNTVGLVIHGIKKGYIVV